MPAIEPAIASSGELRRSTCPRASTLPSRDSSVARRAGRLRRVSASPGLSPGNASSGPQVTCSSATGRLSLPRTRPNTRVWTSTGTTTLPPLPPSGSPVSKRSAVAVAAASR